MPEIDADDICYTHLGISTCDLLLCRYKASSAIAPHVVMLIRVLSGTYYLPLYFQVLGSSATNAGIRSISFTFKLTHIHSSPHRMIPFSFTGAAMAIISGQIVSRLGDYRIIMWCGWVRISNDPDYPLIFSQYM